MIINSQSMLVIGHLTITFYSNGVDKIEMELKKSFIESYAVSGDLCSVRLTEYGDFRSFISPNAAPNSYGSSEDVV